MSSAVSGLAQTVKAMRPMVPAENFEISKKFYADFGFRLSAPIRVAAASYALAGRLEQGQKAMTRLSQLDPALRVSNLRDVLGPYRPEDLARYEEGLRKAGLPE